MSAHKSSLRMRVLSKLSVSGPLRTGDLVQAFDCEPQTLYSLLSLLKREGSLNRSKDGAWSLPARPSKRKPKPVKAPTTARVDEIVEQSKPSIPFLKTADHVIAYLKNVELRALDDVQNDLNNRRAILTSMIERLEKEASK